MSGLEPEGFALPLRKLRVDAELFRPGNVPLLHEEKQLVEAYMSIKGAQTVQWEGKEIPIVALYPQMQDPDRERREQAWRTYLRDPHGTIQQYCQALSLGATRSLPELYTAASAKFAFDVPLLQEMVWLVTGKIEELEQEV